MLADFITVLLILISCDIYYAATTLEESIQRTELYNENYASCDFPLLVTSLLIVYQRYHFIYEHVFNEHVFNRLSGYCWKLNVVVKYLVKSLTTVFNRLSGYCWKLNVVVKYLVKSLTTVPGVYHLGTWYNLDQPLT